MSICAVNGREYQVLTALKTWGQLLDALEQGVGTQRAVVTAVRFGGVDQPSFRSPVLLTHALEAGAPIDVDTCPARTLVAEAVEAALNGLAPLAQAAQQAAASFRSHDLADAHRRLADLVVTLQTLAKLTAAVSQADLSPRTARSDAASASLLERLGQSLESLITGATNEDWTSVADVLDYEMADLLPSWQAVLRALATPESGVDAGGLLLGQAGRAVV